MKTAKIIPFIDPLKILSRVSVNKDNDCWNWIGIVEKKNGYGRFFVKKSPYLAHRIVFEIFNGKLNPLLVLDHTCKNRKCVNPDHLREVTHKINMLENSDSNSFKNSTKTHCPKGHEYSDENTYLDTANRRQCKPCRRASDKIRDAKRKVKIQGNFALNS